MPFRTDWVNETLSLCVQLDTQTLVKNFTDHFYSTAAAVHVRTYMDIMATSFNSTDTLLDYNGRKLVGDPSRHMGITNAVFGNRTLLRAAGALSSAQVRDPINLVTKLWLLRRAQHATR